MGRNGKLVLFTETRLFEYDPVGKSTNLLLEVSGSGGVCAALCFDAEGMPWLATTNGLYRRDPNGTWTHWTTADGLVSNYISDIIEYKYPDGKHSIWIATWNGISEYKYNENTWVAYTTAQGLPSNNVYKFALDGAGDLWISTYNGLVKYNGASFKSVNAPFGTDPVYYKLSGSSDGSVWMATSHKLPYKLYRYRSGTWSQWKQSDIAYSLYIAEIAADDTSVWFRGSDILVKYKAGNFTVYDSTSEPKIKRVNAVIPFDGPGVYFSYNPYLKSGLLYLDESENTWHSGYIEKDMDRFLGNPICLAFDKSDPVETGRYTLEYSYTDETGGDNVYHGETQTFFYETSVGITADKTGYEYMDIADIAVNINGVGSYTVQMSCPESNLSETRAVVIPDGSTGIIEQYRIPIGLQSIYTVNVEAKDVSNRSFNNTSRLYVNPIELDYTGQFKDSIARAGKALEFEVNMKRIFGFSQPLTDELAVTSAQLNYQEIKTVTLQPMGDNRFVYTKPVDMEAPAGFYRVDVQFNLNGVNLSGITKIVASIEI